MATAHLNKIATALPEHDIHEPYIAYMSDALVDTRAKDLFARMAARSGISHRYSVLGQYNIGPAEAADNHFYKTGAFPSTAERMRAYAKHAPDLAERAVRALDLGDDITRVTHLIFASCTGFVAPGIDQILAQRLGLPANLQRSFIGFMGCAAAVPALRNAKAIVESDPAARVLVVNLELCSLHLQETQDLEIALSFVVFADGCTAALVTADESGIALGVFQSALIPGTAEMITWDIGDTGFDMHLSGKVPGTISKTLKADQSVLQGEMPEAIDLWAVHGGGRTILDAVESGLSLNQGALHTSRHVLANYGNMSSATIMFVLREMLKTARSGARGLTMAFGPGMVVESFAFKVA